MAKTFYRGSTSILKTGSPLGTPSSSTNPITSSGGGTTSTVSQPTKTEEALSQSLPPSLRYLPPAEVATRSSISTNRGGTLVSTGQPAITQISQQEVATPTPREEYYQQSRLDRQLSAPLPQTEFGVVREVSPPTLLQRTRAALVRGGNVGGLEIRGGKQFETGTLALGGLVAGGAVGFLGGAGIGFVSRVSPELATGLGIGSIAYSAPKVYTGLTSPDIGEKAYTVGSLIGGTIASTKGFQLTSPKTLTVEQFKIPIKEVKTVEPTFDVKTFSTAIEKVRVGQRSLYDVAAISKVKELNLGRSYEYLSKGALGILNKGKVSFQKGEFISAKSETPNKLITSEIAGVTRKISPKESAGFGLSKGEDLSTQININKQIAKSADTTGFFSLGKLKLVTKELGIKASVKTREIGTIKKISSQPLETSLTLGTSEQTFKEPKISLPSPVTKDILKDILKEIPKTDFIKMSKSELSLQTKVISPSKQKLPALIDYLPQKYQRTEEQFSKQIPILQTKQLTSQRQIIKQDVISKEMERQIQRQIQGERQISIRGQQFQLRQAESLISKQALKEIQLPLGKTRADFFPSIKTMSFPSAPSNILSLNLPPIIPRSEPRPSREGKLRYGYQPSLKAILGKPSFVSKRPKFASPVYRPRVKSIEKISQKSLKSKWF